MSTSAPAVTVGISHQELVERIAAGDRAAETLLVEKFARPIALLLDRQTQGKAEAQDLFQETFRLALEKLRRGELRDAERLPGFLASLARNLAIDFYRTFRRRRTDNDEEQLERIEAPRVSALGEVLDSEKQRIVRQLLSEMTVARDREVLFRFYIAEEDRESLAADLGVDPLQLNRILHRARQRYKELVLARGGGIHERSFAFLLVLSAMSKQLVSLYLVGEL